MKFSFLAIAVTAFAAQAQAHGLRTLHMNDSLARYTRSLSR